MNNLMRKLLSKTNLFFLLALIMLSSNRINAEDQVFKNRMSERTLNDMLSIGDKHIIVGDKGTILLSEAKLEWNTIDIGIENNINAINWWRNHFVAVGEGAILTSTDGKTWEKYVIDKDETDKILNLKGVTSNQDMIVSIGEGLIMTSTDGENWKKILVEPTMVLNDILYQDNQFIAVGSKVIKEIKKPLIMISTDTIQWTEVLLEDECTINEIVYIDGQYSALGENGQIFISKNGQDWDIQDDKFIGDRSHTYDFKSIAVGNNRMLMAGTMSHWMYTNDVQSIIVDLQKDVLQIDSMINELQVNKIYWDGNIFFAIGKGVNGKDIFMSSDGEKWESAKKGCYFNDVNPSDWFYDSVIFLEQKGIITGYEDESFKPDYDMSIEEFIVLVLRATGEDVEVSHDRYWASAYIEKAISLGFIQKDEFESRYTQPIKREEMVKLLMNIIGHEENKDFSSYKSLIKDFDDVDLKYQPFVLKAYATGIIKGYEDGSFRPKQKFRRAEAADVIYKLISNRQ